MTPRALAQSSLLLALLLAGLPAQRTQDDDLVPADLIVIGRIFTGDPIQPIVDALAIRDDRIVAVGTAADLRDYLGKDTHVFTRTTSTVTPGFNDAHTHVLSAAAIARDIDLERASDAEEALTLVREWVEGHAKDELVQATGLRPEIATADPEFGARFERATAGRNALLWGSGLTFALANQGVREHFGLGTGAALPAGVFWLGERPDLRLPVVAGPLLLDLFAPVALLPAPELTARLREVCSQANAMGITSIQEPLCQPIVAALRAMREAGTLSLRVHALTAAAPEPGDADAGATPPAPDPWLSFGTIDLGPQRKLFEAATPLSLAQISKEADVRVRHASGASIPAAERARVLDNAFRIPPEALGAYVGRNVVVSVVPSALLPVIDSTSPTSAPPFPAGEMLPLRSLLDLGGMLAFGTDFDRLPNDPRLALFAATSRTSTREPVRRARRPGDEPREYILDEKERLTTLEALRAFTLGSAHAEGTASFKGTLAPGNLADLVVFEQDLLNTQPRQLLHAQVRATILGGKQVYGR